MDGAGDDDDDCSGRVVSQLLHEICTYPDLFEPDEPEQSGMAGTEAEDLVADGQDEYEEHQFPVRRPPAAACEAAIAALEPVGAPPPGDDDCCPICLDDGEDASFSAPAAWRRIASCGHRFHRECVEPWLWEKLSCPVCRRAAPSAPGYCPFPAIVEEMLAMSNDESLRFERSSRWLNFIRRSDSVGCL
ncbi:hypothetical protein ACP70R_042262 [Stipagrostis hirtigluma subsp. patula]